MSQAQEEREGSPRPSRLSFVGKRLMSFLGVVPLGIYVVLHLWTNLSSLGGPDAFNASLIESRRHPAFVALELLLGAAILVHVVFGVQQMLRWRINNLAARYFRNFKFFLQRLSGIGVGLFLVAHVVKARILPAMTPMGRETWQGMREALHEPITLTVYILGLIGISYHLAEGLWTFLITWGFTVTPAAQRRSEYLAVAFMLALLCMSGLSIYGFLQPMPDPYAQALR